MLGCGPLLLGVAKVRVNQYAHDTLYDRYPAIYQQVSRLALETFGNAPKVMSFGSSTGLEALTLAQKYFEKSVIVGVDVDEVTLSQARSTCANVSSRVFMFNGEKTALGALGLYDVILVPILVAVEPRLQPRVGEWLNHKPLMREHVQQRELREATIRHSYLHADRVAAARGQPRQPWQVRTIGVICEEACHLSLGPARSARNHRRAS